MNPTSAVPHRVSQLSTALAQARPMRRGSVAERKMKCGQANCPCQQDPKARHGPYYSLTRAIEGKTHTRYLNRQQAELAGRQIEAGREFRQQVEDFWEVCERWADTQLDGEATSEEVAEKKGSRRTWTSKSGKKWRPSSAARPGRA